MSPSKMMEEVWRWKDEVAKETEGMTPQEVIAYFHQAERRFLEKTGGGELDLPRMPALRARRPADQREFV
jgi:hypothetical protein